MKVLEISTTKRSQFIDITSKIEGLIQEEKVNEGICVIFCPHTTAGLTINENADPSVRSDILNHMQKSIPERAGYSHAEGNADSHIKSSLFGSSLHIIVGEGGLVLGPWQGVYFCEFDGPRSRKVYIKFIKA